MKRVVGILLLGFSMALNLTPTSFAVWNGESALHHKRIAPFLNHPTKGWCGGSAFMYTSRIVFTAAHAFFGDDRDPKRALNLTKVWIGAPGEIVRDGSPRSESEKIFMPSNYKPRTFWTGGKNITRENDFAVIVLKTPLEVDGKPVELMTEQMHRDFIANKELVSNAGYGFQYPPDNNPEMCVGLEPKIYQLNVTDEQPSPMELGDIIFSSGMNLKTGVGKPSGCDGDSGSGFFKMLPDKYLYLGANGAGGWMPHNCGSWKEVMDREIISASWPVYLYLDLIRQAEEYVAANPYVAPKKKKEKILFGCINKKGDIKQFEKYKVKCPRGYKLQ